MAMSISDEGVAITSRFFKAIDLLVESRRLRGLKSFTDSHGVNRRNLQHLKSSPTNTVLKPELLSIMVTHYGISALWLLTGSGPVFCSNENLNNRHNKD